MCIRWRNKISHEGWVEHPGSLVVAVTEKSLSRPDVDAKTDCRGFCCVRRRISCHGARTTGPFILCTLRYQLTRAKRTSDAPRWSTRGPGWRPKRAKNVGREGVVRARPAALVLLHSTLAARTFSAPSPIAYFARLRTRRRSLSPSFLLFVSDTPAYSRTHTVLLYYIYIMYCVWCIMLYILCI